MRTRVRRAVDGMPSNLVEEDAGVFALVDAAAGAEEDGVRVDGINDDGEHVGVFDDAFFDVLPVLAAVVRLPGQVPGSGVDDVGVGGVDGERLDLVNLFAAGRADEVPDRRPRWWSDRRRGGFRHKRTAGSRAPGQRRRSIGL